MTSAASNFFGKANAARAISGIAVIVGGGTFGYYLKNFDDDESTAESGGKNQQRIKNYEYGQHHLLIAREQSSTLVEHNNKNGLTSSNLWSMIHNNHYNNGLIMKSACEAAQTKNNNDNYGSDPSYPDLSRFGSRSYLRRYLTPEVYASLRDKQTKNGVTLEDIIKSGVCLPFGANPPRGTGVYAGDEESYNVFAELLVPVIEDYHHYHFVETQTGAAASSSSPSSFNNNNFLNSKDNNKSKSNKNNSNSHTTFVMPLTPSTTMTSSSSSSSSSAVVVAGRRPTKIRRQFTNLNPNYVLQQKLDPTGDYILKTRMRVARSIKGFPFSPVISRAQRRELEQLFEAFVDEDWNGTNNINNNNVDDNDDDDDDDDDDDKILRNYNNNGGLRGGNYKRVLDMTNEQHEDLITRHILFHDPDEYNISAGIGRDWPDGRGVYTVSDNNNSGNVHSANNSRNDNPDLVMWLNKEDHLRIVATSNGGDLSAVFGRLSRALTQVEQSLHKRGHAFCYHPRYGFVNTSPENLGTALRASVFIKLNRLGQQPGFDELLDRLHLEASSRFKDKQSGGTYTGIFDIANSERLGQSEVQLINTMINGVGRLIELEKRLEQGETVNLDEVR
jgi:creatine kinase